MLIISILELSVATSLNSFQRLMFTETYCSNTVLSSLWLIVWWWNPKGGKPVGMQGEEDGNLLVNTNDDMHFPSLEKRNKEENI